MRWPFSHKLETRDDSYTDTLIAALLSQASGKTLAVPAAVGALEACAGVVGRGFMSAEVTGRTILTDALTPDCLSLIGRSMIRRGELVLLIDTEGGRLQLLPAETHDVTGGPKPETWWYRVTLAGPTRTYTYGPVPATSVLHFRYSYDPQKPWRGHGPIEVASLSGRLSAETLNQLADESSGPVGALLGSPKDGADETVAGIKSDIRNARGRVALMETGDYDAPGSGKVDLQTRRFGAEPPQSLVNLAEYAFKEIVAACGLSVALWGAGDSASTREAWRLALFGVIAPLGKIVSQELSEKLEDSITLDWQELRATDLAGRARAFQSMVGGGMAVADAIAVAGLMVEE